MSYFIGSAHVVRNMDFNSLLRKPCLAMLHWSVALGSVFCTCFTNYSTIFNSRVEHLEDFNGVIANHALIGDGAIALCPFGIWTFDGPHLRAVVYRPNICNIFIHTNEVVCVRYVVADTTIPSCFLSRMNPNALHWIMYQ